MTINHTTPPTPRRQALIDAARAMIGMPFRHRGRTVRGVDCAGMLILAMRAVGVAATDLTTYGREPNKAHLERVLELNLGPPVDRPPEPGDVLLFSHTVGAPASHVGLCADHPLGGLSIIHAHGSYGAVTEHRLDQGWSDRLVSVYTVDSILG